MNPGSLPQFNEPGCTASFDEPGFICVVMLICRGAFLVLFAAISMVGVCSADTWRGLEVAPEHECSDYRPSDYRYPQSVEAQIVAQMGGRIYGPYTGTTFNSTAETDIEHIVARSQAHNSGLCANDLATRRAFATDLLNLTLASPRVNRCSRTGKCDKDAAEWLPQENQCWFAQRIVDVRLKYGLTIDEAEADALDGILSGCRSTALVFLANQDLSAAGHGAEMNATSADDAADVLTLWDDNGDGRITCIEARAHNLSPVLQGHAAYPLMHDRDGDDVVCE